MSDRFTADKLAWLEQVQDDGELSATVFAVAFGIARHLNRETGDAWPSQATLGEMAGVSDRQIRKLLKILNFSGTRASPRQLAMPTSQMPTCWRP
ncbi:helix-turn-helix domain-containing protein [Brevundimonas vesicularis]|uniref:helix-turn-helix domain-containing protein n=1 Tax=Brevundimonas vesicularis TaxID=41276 RepID=UPI0022EC47BF|nr:helix-turn-helix domain-containing protein [Brevundimonas vesicularis]WBT05041.1 helix-turn-helix domain-containing protein [Brevundimonas vesicularis]